MVLLSLPVMVRADSPWLEVNRTLVDKHIVPRYQTLVEATALFEERTTAFCADPAPAGLDEVRDGYQKTMDAWMEIQHLRFGPVDLYLRYNRFQLWPDKHNTAERQLNKALAEQDVTQLAEDKFPYTSVALQGLSTVERLLYDDASGAGRFGTSKQPSYQCLLLKAVTRNLAVMSSDILKEWTTAKPSYREIVLDAEHGNSYYASSQEFSAHMLNNLYTALQFIVDQKLLLPMGANPAEANPKRAESWRSGRSARNIILNLQAAESLYLTGFAPQLTGDKAALDKEIRHDFELAEAAAQGVSQSFYDALQSPAQRPALDRLLAAASDLKRQLGGPLPLALNLPLGFNSLDGD
jgi:predicted lipoprotein